LLFEDLRSTDPATCENAVSALGGLGDPAGIPILIRALKDPATPVHIHVFGNVLGEIANETAVPWLTEALNDAHAVVRRRAAYALEVICTKALDSPILLTHFPAPVYALAEGSLIEVLCDSDAGVRARAAHALCRMERAQKYSRSIEQRRRVFLTLAEALKHEDDPRVQQILIVGLERGFDSVDDRNALRAILSRKPLLAKVRRLFVEDSVWDSFEENVGH